MPVIGVRLFVRSLKYRIVGVQSRSRRQDLLAAYTERLQRAARDISITQCHYNDTSKGVGRLSRHFLLAVYTIDRYTPVRGLALTLSTLVHRIRISVRLRSPRAGRRMAFDEIRVANPI